MSLPLPPLRPILLAACLLLAACQDPAAERAEDLGDHVHRLTVALAGDEPVEARLVKLALAICPTGYNREGDELMPPDAARYRVWLVRCR